MAPRPQVPVLVQGVDAQRIHGSPLADVTRVEVGELDLAPVRDGIPDYRQGRVRLRLLDRDLEWASGRAAREFGHERPDDVTISVLGKRGEILEPRDEGRSLPRGEARRIVDRDSVRDDDFVSFVEGIPIDVEEVVVLILAALTRDAGDGDEPYGLANVLLGNVEVRCRLGDGRLMPVKDIRHE